MTKKNIHIMNINKQLFGSGYQLAVKNGKLVIINEDGEVLCE